MIFIILLLLSVRSLEGLALILSALAVGCLLCLRLSLTLTLLFNLLSAVFFVRARSCIGKVFKLFIVLRKIYVRRACINNA